MIIDNSAILGESDETIGLTISVSKFRSLKVEKYAGILSNSFVNVLNGLLEKERILFVDNRLSICLFVSMNFVEIESSKLLCCIFNVNSKALNVINNRMSSLISKKFFINKVFRFSEKDLKYCEVIELLDISVMGILN
jgi:hypothetical protein